MTVFKDKDPYNCIGFVPGVGLAMIILPTILVGILMSKYQMLILTPMLYGIFFREFRQMLKNYKAYRLVTILTLLLMTVLIYVSLEIYPIVGFLVLVTCLSWGVYTQKYYIGYMSKRVQQ